MRSGTRVAEKTKKMTRLEQITELLENNPPMNRKTLEAKIK